MGLYDAYVPTPSGDDYPTKIEDFLTIVGTHVTALQAVTPPDQSIAADTRGIKFNLQFYVSGKGK